MNERLLPVDFGRAVCGELAEAERREWIVTNGLGGFASGTIAGTLTRRYHGLLFAALHPPVDRTLLVTKFDERVSYAGGEYDLFANRWKDGYLAPQGWTSIERFYLDGTTPVWTFAIDDASIEKRIWMEPGANVTFVRYRVLRASAPVAFSIRVLTNYRGMHGNTHAGDWHVNLTPVKDGVRINAFDGAQPYWISSAGASFEPDGTWYRDFVLAEETRRGLDDRDDNLSAGVLRATLAQGESLTVAASDSDPAGLDPARAEAARALQDERAIAQVDGPPWIVRCALAADAFLVRRPIAREPGARSVIAGYHWFGDWGRDTMISLPGLALETGRPELAKQILLTFSHFVDGGMLPNFFPDENQAPEYNTVDAALWYVEAIARYVEATGDDATLRALWPSLSSVIGCYRAGTRYNIHMAADGLIVADAPGVQLTWMDAKAGDWVVTPRRGKPVEIGALWYNALLRAAELAPRAGETAADYAAVAATARDGFDRFWDAERGSCFDVIDGPDGNDASLRPNQIFAVALANSPLSPERGRGVVDACERHLLTSMGLRTLAPSDPRFQPDYAGSPHDRDAAYHQGTVWPWLIGPFAIAHARVYGDRDAARAFLTPFADALGDAGLGTIGEIAAGAAPFPPRGAIAQAWSVAEILRAWRELGR